MYNQALLITAISYEAAKRDIISGSRTVWQATESRIAAVATWYDTTWPPESVCTGNLLCGREGRRHKADCLGKVESIGQYARKLGNA